MLTDHVGYLLFPDIAILRYIGRISMPLFAFCIGEGCRHTRSISKYFIKVLALATLCQAVFLTESLISGGIHRLDFNILFTFSFSILICGSYKKLSSLGKEATRSEVISYNALFIGAILSALFCTTFLDMLVPIKIHFEYSFAGAVLPLFATFFEDKRRQLPAFTLGLLLFNLLLCTATPYIWFSLVALPIIYAYNGSRGKYSLKAFFYLFYPLHFALLYLIQMIAF